MNDNTGIVSIPAGEMENIFYEVLKQVGFNDLKALACARIFMENSLDGVYTHGVYRFQRFVQYTKKGWISPGAASSRVHSFGCIEQWTGNMGPGPLNAQDAANRSMELAKENGMGCVSLASTNHWMRGGTYGWMAARKGFAFIAWTNTIANMPPWGATEPKLGNNPLVLAVPFQNEAIVLDMAMSQYSFGALELQELREKKLPVPGGFDNNGELTTDPSEILASRRVLPIGYWKGAGLSLLLDIFATILSGGSAAHEISQQPAEINVSQVFIAIDLSRLHNYSTIASSIAQIINDYKKLPGNESQVVYPGEKVLATRKENSENGIPVFRSVWDEIKSLA